MITLPQYSALVLNSIVVFLFLFFVVIGYSRGLIHQLLDLAGFLAGILLAWLFAPALATSMPLLDAKWDVFTQPILGEIFFKLSNTVLWFTIIFLAVAILVAFILKPFMKFIHKVPIARTINRILGALYGLIPPTFFSILIALLLSTPIFANGRSTVEAAGFLKPFLKASDYVMGQIYATVDQTGILHKLAAGEKLSVEDLKGAPDLLETLGIPQDLMDSAANLVQGLKPKPEDIARFQAYIDEKKITFDQVVDFLKNFGVSPEEAQKAAQSFTYPQ